MKSQLTENNFWILNFHKTHINQDGRIVNPFPMILEQRIKPQVWVGFYLFIF